MEKVKNYWISERGSFIRFDCVKSARAGKQGEDDQDCITVYVGNTSMCLAGNNMKTFLELFTVWLDEDPTFAYALASGKKTE